MGDKRATVECRQLVDLAPQVAHAEAVADAAIAKLARQRLAARNETWDWPSWLDRETQSAVSDIAALTGWDDGRAVKRAEGYAAALAKLAEQREKLFASVHAAASDSVAFKGFDVKLGSASCATDRCTLHATIDPTRSGSTVEFSRGHNYLYLARPKGAPIVSESEVKSGYSASDVTIDFTVIGLAGLDEGPAVLGVCVKPDLGDDVCRHLKVR